MYYRVRLLLCCVLLPLTAVRLLTLPCWIQQGLAIDSAAEVSTSHTAAVAAASFAWHGCSLQ